jgi:hypothetical protein
MAIALTDIGQQEWTDYVADMREEEERFWQEEWKRQAEEMARQEEESFPYEFEAIVESDRQEVA